MSSYFKASTEDDDEDIDVNNSFVNKVAVADNEEDDVVDENDENDEEDVDDENDEDVVDEDVEDIVGENDEEDEDEDVEDDDEDDDDEDDDEEDDDDEDSRVPKKSAKKSANKSAAQISSSAENYAQINDTYDSDEDDDDGNEAYLQKFNQDINRNYLETMHPECVSHNYDEIIAMSKIVRDPDNNIVDPLHRTLPYLTKFERTRILGQRAKQINAGATPFVKTPESVIDGYIIAELELKEKRIPFIIRRPLPNGGSEYWPVRELENIMF